MSAALRSRAARWLVGALLGLGALVFAPPAGAVVAAGSHVSIQPLSPQAGGGALEDPLDGTTAGVTYHGGPVVHALATYAIYWDPSHTFATSTENLINGYLAGSAHDSGATDNIFSVASQYTDAGGGATYSQTYGGSFVDTDPYPTSGDCSETMAGAPTCLYDSQEVSELESFVAAHHLPTGLGAVYIVLTPTTVVSCTNGTSQCSNNAYCSFHSYATEGSSTLLYIGIPFTLLTSASSAKECQDDGNAQLQAPNADPGFGDVALKSLSHEELETITDPLLSSWYDADGNEIADLCNGTSWNADSFLPVEGGSASAGTLWNQTIDGAHYYLQGAWSNEANGCALLSGFSPSITAPQSSLAGAAVTLSATAGTAAPVSTYAWSFGDGQSASGQSLQHAYTTPGQYTITLTVTDAYGNTGTATAQIDVTAPPGRTAGAASGSTGSVSISRCGTVRHGRRGSETRKCTTTTVLSQSAGLACKPASAKRARTCYTVIRTVTRRVACIESRLSRIGTWSRRCATTRVVSNKR